MVGDRDAADDDDAAAVLDFVEHSFEVGVERRVAAIRRRDVGEFLGPDAAQHILQRRGMARRQVEGDVVLGEIAATPDHLVVRRHVMDRTHRSLPQR